MTQDTFNPPAYPGPRNDEAGVFVGIHLGMSLRDHFAGLAMAAALDSSPRIASMSNEAAMFAAIATVAYRAADAMLAARAKATPPADAIAQLREHQRQIDADGAQVGVSRQALDEVLAWIGGGQ